MSAPHPEIVIVRRRSAHDDGHHGGAWKIAFADFMTAMMAFFLVLWIISATDKNTKTLIARYFNPVKVEEPAKARKGIRGVAEKDADSSIEDSGALNPASDHGEAANKSARESAQSNSPNENDRPQKPETKAPPDPARPTPTMSEQELFSDPRASLDKIGGATPAGPLVDSPPGPKGFGEVGPSANDVIRDPFRPLGSDTAVNVVTSDPGAPPAAPAAKSGPQSSGASDVAVPQGQAHKETPPPLPSPGAGDLPQQAVAPAQSTAIPSAPNAAEARAAAAAGFLANVRKRLGGEAQAPQGPQLEVKATDEGILISLTDRQNFSMFAIGSAEPQPRVLRMMDAIAASLQGMPGTIIVRGHTDAHPYRSATYDNWRLSSARAQMAYYMLNRAGIPEKRFERIEGFADHRLKDPAHPFAAENRRIEILLRETKS
jgi:chemotaxis protein MotB